MSQPVYNLHNHTPFSDGAYTADELCEAHLALDRIHVAGIGISDHMFCTPSSREIRSPRDFERTFAAETRGYVAEITAARERWAGRLDVWVGCEVNWPLNKMHLDAIKPLMRGMDFVLFEYLDWAGLTQLASQARRWPCPIGIAHTDVQRQFPNTSMDQVVRTLANARIFYEINTKFLPLEQMGAWFKLLPKHKVRVSFATDTHDDLGEIDDLSTLVDFAIDHGLEDRFFVPSVGRTADAGVRVA
jgi:histidinol phosphatase-like PHP family hydrolase